MKLLTALLVCVASFLAASFQCNKDADQDQHFCSIPRALGDTIVQRTGTVSYYDRYKRHAIVLDSAINNNIDNSYIGLVCSLPTALQIPGTKVMVSGTLKNFNAAENVRPVMGGEQLYYLDVKAIHKKE